MYTAQIKTGSGYYDILLLLHTRFVHKNCAKDYGTTLQDLTAATLYPTPPSLSLTRSLAHSCSRSPLPSLAAALLWLWHMNDERHLIFVYGSNTSNI